MCRVFFQLLMLLAVLAPASVWADDDLRVAYGGACALHIASLPGLEAVGRDIHEAKRVRGEDPGVLSSVLRFFRNFGAQLAAGRVAGPAAYEAQPKDENTRVHYVQSLPGKTKSLRNILTAEEVNILLNQMRSLFFEYGELGDGREVVYDFKSIRYNQSADDEDIQSVEQRLQIVEMAFRHIQSGLLESGLLGNLGLRMQNSRLVAVGSGRTEMQAVVAPRFSENHVVRFEDVRHLVVDAAWALKILGARLIEDLSSDEVLKTWFVENGQLSLGFFEIIRSASAAEDVLKLLKEMGTEMSEKELSVLAENIARFSVYIDKFVPGTQLDKNTLETVDSEHSPTDHQHPLGTTSLLTVDVKAVGARILMETWVSLSRALTHEDRSSLRIEKVLEHIHISESLKYLHESLQSAMKQVQQLEGENILRHWLTGDEIVFYLEKPSQLSKERIGPHPHYRILETQLEGTEKLNRLDSAYLREVGEQAIKIMEADLGELEVELVQISIQNEKPVLKLFVVELPDLYFEHVEARLRAVLQKKFPQLGLLNELQISLIGI